MSPGLTNFLFEAANFLLLAAALGWLLFKPVRRALDAEQARHSQQEDEARRMRQEAEVLVRAARAEREAAARESDERRRALLESARREGAREAETARRAQAEERRRMERELLDWKDARAEELTETVGRIAAESVRGLLAALEGPALDLALVRAACVELGAVPVEARGAALVECARPLDAESRALLESVLGGALKERVVGELQAGVRVTTSAGQVDATAVAMARRAARALKRTSDAPEGDRRVGDA
ncbi:hypothetical protein [Myxococcus stipitatus]|uniref:hypothetical protein n=1 Tax=Myxococcus stipitatus TaxID=83455 RepID=UPI0030CE7743